MLCCGCRYNLEKVPRNSQRAAAKIVPRRLPLTHQRASNPEGTRLLSKGEPDMLGTRAKLAAAFFGLCLALGAPGSLLAKERLTVDLVNEPSSLDPHVQWNPDSYYVYRNIFDNL